MIQRLALYPHQRVVIAFKRQLLGHVLKDPGNPAMRMRVYDNSEGLAIRQIPPVFIGFERAIDFQLRLAPFAPVRHFRKFALGAYGIKHLRIGRLAVEEAGLQTP